MVVVDVETTGKNPTNHSIIEIGAVDFFNPINIFEGQCHIWKGAQIDKIALEWNGASVESVTDESKDSLGVLMSNFIQWLDNIEDKTFAGQNIDFDIGFLDFSSKKSGMDRKFGKRKIDQHSLVYTHMLKRELTPPLKNGLSDISGDFIIDYVGIQHEPRPHSAINGAKYEAEAISRLVFGKSLFNEFHQCPIPHYLIS
ncbi:3'-5' exonuclease DinG [subsurface metagenome]